MTKPTSGVEAVDEFWTPVRIGHVLADCATYLRTLYVRHAIGPGKQALDPDKLDAASRAATALATPAASPAPDGWPIATDDEVEALARACDWNNRRYMTPDDYAIWCERMRKFARLASPSPAPAAVEANRDVFNRLLTAAKLLYANSEGCAVNHYGEDFATHGLPGWLASCASDIEAASAVLHSSATSANTPTTPLCDCERGHNGIGITGRECDCSPASPSPAKETSQD